MVTESGAETQLASLVMLTPSPAMDATQNLHDRQSAASVSRSSVISPMLAAVCLQWRSVLRQSATWGQLCDSLWPGVASHEGAAGDALPLM